MRSVAVLPEPGESHEVALYRHLLEPGFAGMTLKLAAHEYMLGARAGQEALVSLGVGQFTREIYDALGLDSEVAVMAEKGYIHLGDRSLLGVNVMTYDRDGVAVDVDEKKGLTVLDGSGLEALLWGGQHYERKLTVFAENRPLMRAERGNRIERLTLRWSPYSSVFQPTLAVVGPAVQIAECKFEATGPAILVYPAGMPNLSISAEIVGNVIRRMDRYAIVASTFMCANAHNHLFLSGNRIQGEVIGGFGHVLIYNANADGGEIHVTSGRNRYLGPTTGIRLRGGNAFLTDATRNSIILNSIDDRFEGMQAGVLVWGAAGAHRADGNEVVVRLIGSRFERTASVNVGAVGRQGGPERTTTSESSSTAQPTRATCRSSPWTGSAAAESTTEWKWWGIPKRGKPIQRCCRMTPKRGSLPQELSRVSDVRRQYPAASASIQHQRLIRQTFSQRPFLDRVQILGLTGECAVACSGRNVVLA